MRRARPGLEARAVLQARAALETLALLLALLAWGCGRHAGPPAIVEGTPCVSCGMPARDLHFACEREVAGVWRVYDSIECLLRDAAATPGGTVYLGDYDRRALLPADSLWVVRGNFPTPMSGGLAAFLDRASADTVAARTGGRVGRLHQFRGAASMGAPGGASSRARLSQGGGA